MKSGLILAAAGLALSVCAAQGGSFGNAPWCAVQNLGAGDVVWDCEFRTAEECAPNVIADAATAQVLIRLVGPSDETRKAVEQAAAGLAEVDFTLEIPFVRMRKIEGLDTMVAAFTTDIPALDQ